MSFVGFSLCILIPILNGIDYNISDYDYFVAFNGSDSNDCTSFINPCKSFSGVNNKINGDYSILRRIWIDSIDPNLALSSRCLTGIGNFNAEITFNPVNIKTPTDIFPGGNSDIDWCMSWFPNGGDGYPVLNPMHNVTLNHFIFPDISSNQFILIDTNIFFTCNNCVFDAITTGLERYIESRNIIFNNCTFSNIRNDGSDPFIRHKSGILQFNDCYFSNIKSQNFVDALNEASQEDDIIITVVDSSFNSSDPLIFINGFGFLGFPDKNVNIYINNCDIFGIVTLINTALNGEYTVYIDNTVFYGTAQFDVNFVTDLDLADPDSVSITPLLHFGAETTATISNVIFKSLLTCVKTKEFYTGPIAIWTFIGRVCEHPQTQIINDGSISMNNITITAGNYKLSK